MPPNYIALVFSQTNQMLVVCCIDFTLIYYNVIITVVSQTKNQKSRLLGQKFWKCLFLVLLLWASPVVGTWFEQGVKARTFGIQCERNFCYDWLALTSLFGLCFMSVCLIKSNCYSLIYSSLDLSHLNGWHSTVETEKMSQSNPPCKTLEEFKGLRLRVKIMDFGIHSFHSQIPCCQL